MTTQEVIEVAKEHKLAAAIGTGVASAIIILAAAISNSVPKNDDARLNIPAQVRANTTHIEALEIRVDSVREDQRAIKDDVGDAKLILCAKLLTDEEKKMLKVCPR